MPPSHEPLVEAVGAMRGKRVLVVGESILDAYLTGHVERLCREAPVPILDLDALGDGTDAAGGAANTAANIRSLGGEPLFVSAIGNDGEAARLRTALERVGVAAHRVVVSPSRRTLAKQRLLAGEQMLLRFDSGTTESLDDDTE